MKALSGFACWFYAMLYSGKNIENRKKASTYRGQLVLHTSAKQPVSEVEDWSDLYSSILDKNLNRDRKLEFLPSLIELEKTKIIHDRIKHLKSKWKEGYLIGTVEVVGCYKELAMPEHLKESPWAFGPYCYEVSKPFLFNEPIKAKGNLGFWTLNLEQEEAVKEQINPKVLLPPIIRDNRYQF